MPAYFLAYLDGELLGGGEVGFTRFHGLRIRREKVIYVPTRRGPDLPKFHQQIFELARVCHRSEELVNGFKPGTESNGDWVKQDASARGTCMDGLSSTERDELETLRP